MRAYLDALAVIALEDVAKKLAYDHLRFCVSLYSTKEITQKWNAALPGLNAASMFSSLASHLVH